MKQICIRHRTYQTCYLCECSLCIMCKDTIRHIVRMKKEGYGQFQTLCDLCNNKWEFLNGIE